MNRASRLSTKPETTSASRVQEQGRPGALLIAYDLAAPLVAWALVSLVRYDYFVVRGGLAGLAETLPVVGAAQWLAYWWIGFLARERRADRIADLGMLARAVTLGVLVAAMGLILVSRFEGVSRTALALYPLVTLAFLATPEWRAQRRRPPAPAGAANGGDREAVHDRVDATAPEAPAVDGAARATRAVSEAAPRVTAVIVNFNGGMLLTDSVKSVLSSTERVKVVVSDNGSTDGSIEHLRRVTGRPPRLVIMENGQNLGFARGNNVALPMTEGEHLLFLNPDCVVEPDTIRKMTSLMERIPEAGMAGCLIRNLDGSEQAGCRRAVPTPYRTSVRTLGLDKLFPNNPRFQSFVLKDTPLPEEPIDIEALSGAFMFVKRKALEDVGPLDEGYFLHCEDLDWCMRFREKGWRIIFDPTHSVTHAQGVCSADRPFRVLWYKHRGMVRFYGKFFRSHHSSGLTSAVIAAVWVRFAIIFLMLFFSKERARKYTAAVG
jgi:GT2 family glycosyltransferase